MKERRNEERRRDLIRESFLLTIFITTQEHVISSASSATQNIAGTYSITYQVAVATRTELQGHKTSALDSQSWRQE